MRSQFSSGIKSFIFILFSTRFFDSAYSIKEETEVDHPSENFEEIIPNPYATTIIDTESIGLSLCKNTLLLNKEGKIFQKWNLESTHINFFIENRELQIKLTPKIPLEYPNDSVQKALPKTNPKTPVFRN
jgi:hypothetical protein